MSTERPVLQIAKPRLATATILLSRKFQVSFFIVDKASSLLVRGLLGLVAVLKRIQIVTIRLEPLVPPRKHSTV